MQIGGPPSLRVLSFGISCRGLTLFLEIPLSIVSETFRLERTIQNSCFVSRWWFSQQDFTTDVCLEKSLNVSLLRFFVVIVDQK